MLLHIAHFRSGLDPDHTEIHTYTKKELVKECLKMLAPNYIVTEEFQQIYLWTLGTILNIQSTHDLVSKSSVSFISQTY